MLGSGCAAKNLSRIDLSSVQDISERSSILFNSMHGPVSEQWRQPCYGGKNRVSLNLMVNALRELVIKRLASASRSGWRIGSK